MLHSIQYQSVIMATKSKANTKKGGRSRSKKTARSKAAQNRSTKKKSTGRSKKGAVKHKKPSRAQQRLMMLKAIYG
jgi:hypothetical protein